MNGVLGMLELLGTEELDTEQRHLATTAYRSAQALLAIINDILDFSKAEAGKLTLTCVDFHLHDIVEEVRLLFAERAHSKGIALHYDVSQTVPAVVCGDPVRLRQILTNLVGNAIKFTDHGEVMVHVTVEEALDEAVRLRFTIRDTGIGIAPEQHSCLFQAFTQVDGSSTRRYGGTGLGLTIAKQLIEMMGGSIGLDSAVGQGTTFWFTVQLATRHTSSQPLLIDEPVSAPQHDLVL
jgi:signal transduction histidine kinase